MTDVETFGNIDGKERFSFHRVKQSHIKEDRKEEREERCGKTERKRDQEKRKKNFLTLFHLTNECLTFVDKNYNYVFVCL